jgi:hypothetical protein
VIKSALKGTHQLNGNENNEELAEKVLQAAEDRITPEIARNQFRHCKIIV